jgi:hypothetical protein
MSSQNFDAKKLSDIRSKLGLAFGFTILAALFWLGVGGFFVFTVSLITATRPDANTPPILFIIAVGALVFMGLVVYLLVRINRLRKAAERADLVTLKRYNSLGWAIFALLFTGIIAGIMLLLVNGPIKEIGSSPIPNQ